MATTYTPLLELPKHDPADPFDITKINEGFDKTDAGMAKAYRGKAAHNLLVNSDFRASHIIAQAGLNGLHGTTKYVGDRWISWDADATFADEYITPGSPIDQRIALDMVDLNKTYTGAFCLADGTIKVSSATLTAGVGSYAFGMHAIAETSHVRIRLMTNFSIRWVALYEGAYTADTLPEYQYKGYAAELAECQRYYYQTWNGIMSATPNVNGIITRQCMSHSRLADVELPCAMRVTPTITMYTSNARVNTVRNWNNNADEVSGMTASYANNKSFVPASEANGLTVGQWYCFHYAASADL